MSANTIQFNFIDGKKRDLVIILPGGGYSRTSPREGFPVSKLLEENGFHTAIYYYRNELVSLKQLTEEASSIILRLGMRKDIKNIYILGFSAGGHLAGILSSLFTKNVIKGVIFAYPVVSTKSGLIHEGSFERLKVDLDDDINKYDLINYINNSFPNAFIFHTGRDQSVNVLNSIELYKALLFNNINTELHIYNDGKHGMSIGTAEVAFEDSDPKEFMNEYKYQSNWTNLMIKWLKMTSGDQND